MLFGNEVVCKVCYPLVKGAKATCREHELEAALNRIDEINNGANPEIQKVLDGSIGVRLPPLPNSTEST